MKKNKFGLFCYIFFILIFLGGGAFFIYSGLSNFNNTIMTVIGAVLAIIALILLFVLIVKYNTSIRYSNKVKESLSLVDIHLKLRFDLVPNLVEVVKGYLKHEKQVLEEVTNLRNTATDTTSEQEKLECANKILPKLRQIIAVSESYPDLKAQPLFKSLMTELGEIEDKLVASRRIYDSNVNAYNSYLQSFPNNIITAMFGFKTFEMFKIDTGEGIIPAIFFNN